MSYNKTRTPRMPLGIDRNGLSAPRALDHHDPSCVKRISAGTSMGCGAQVITGASHKTAQKTQNLLWLFARVGARFSQGAASCAATAPHHCP